jgi:hypothetical protein
MSIIPNDSEWSGQGDPWQITPHPVSPLVRSDFDPVNGVTLDLFAEIARALASTDDHQANGGELAEAYGISAADWHHASRVWNCRIADNPAVARALSRRYRTARRPAMAS